MKATGVVQISSLFLKVYTNLMPVKLTRQEPKLLTENTTYYYNCSCNILTEERVSLTGRFSHSMK